MAKGLLWRTGFFFFLLGFFVSFAMVKDYHAFYRQEKFFAEKCFRFGILSLSYLRKGSEMKTHTERDILNDFDAHVKQISCMVRRVGIVKAAMDLLCDSFLARANDNDIDPLWKRFYHVQMTSYIIEKKNIEITPPEGDMVHDLIRDAWIDVKDYMENSKFGPIENLDQWFKTIHIDFPVDENDTLSFFDDAFETMLCQNDAKKGDLHLSV